MNLKTATPELHAAATRELERRIPPMAASDGAGVKLRRSIGAQPALRVDPFLMLDEFYSDNPDDYLAGFPSHPHRGFETVTIMLDGHLRHEDHLGNQGDLGPGDVQWMTAARGIIHSEMPQQLEGRMRGFQLWINLPAADKMKPAQWRDVPAPSIPVAELGGGASARVIAGHLQLASGSVEGAVTGTATAPLLLDLRLPESAEVRIPVPAGHAVALYAYDGAVTVGSQAGRLDAPLLGVLGAAGEVVQLRAVAPDTRVLLLAARPLREPVVQYGPFVMNRTREIEQALADYRDGSLADPA